MSDENQENNRVVLDGGLWQPVVPVIAVTVYVALVIWANITGELARVQSTIQEVGNPGFAVLDVAMVVVVVAVLTGLIQFLIQSGVRPGD